MSRKLKKIIRPEPLMEREFPLLDPQLLTSYSRTFLGYGNPKAATWFIGPEEGGGATKSHVEKRLRAWKKLGEKQFMDVREFHREIGERQFFEAPVRFQMYWKKISLISLAAQGMDADNMTSVRNYQATELGSPEGAELLLEAFPLPAPGTSTWKYDHWTDIENLQTRKLYHHAWERSRVSAVRELISIHDVKTIFYMGHANRELWIKIAGATNIREHAIRVREGYEPRYYVAQSNGVQHVFCFHPSTRKVPNSYYRDLGRRLRLSQLGWEN
jgi:hypothetical protein